MEETLDAPVRRGATRRLATWAALAALAAASAMLVATGILGVGRGGGRSMIDFEVVYAAGKAINAGIDPYAQTELGEIILGVEPHADLGAPYSYPPHAGALFALLGLVDYPHARLIWLLIELLSVVVATALMCRLLPLYSPALPPHHRIWLAALALAHPVVSNDLWLGQPALPAYAGLIMVWYGSALGHTLVAAAGLVLATIKPQLSVLVVLWLIVMGRFRLLGIAAALALVLSAVSFWRLGLQVSIVNWLEHLSAHTQYSANAPGAEHTIGVRSLLFAAGLPVPGLELVGAALVVVLWYFRDRFNENEIFGLLLGLTLLWVFNVDSAYVCTLPIVAALWPQASQRRSVLWASVLLGLAFAFPRRIVRLTEIPLLNHWRTLIVLALLALLLALVVSERSRRAVYGLAKSRVSGA